tara:strand:- start:5683 stop:6138 length:456 start_codon:yes stop_codon:yes gene_type:complete
MSQQRTLSGAHIKLYVNGVVYNEVQSLNYTIDYGEEPIYGIDSVFPQEIKITRISISGTISGVRVKGSNGIQNYNLRPKITDSFFAPYISIRITDRKSGEDIMFIPYAKVTNETLNVSAKSVVKANFSFTGLQGQQTLDRGKSGGGGLFGF